jgi:hypothetical protein
MKTRHHTSTKNNFSSRGFIGGGLLIAFAAGLMAMYTAWGFTKTIGATANTQKSVQTKVQLERMAKDLIETSVNVQGAVIAAPNMASDAGGIGDKPSVTANAEIWTQKVTEAAGFLPSGYNFRRTRDVLYAPFYYRATASTPAPAKGYIISDKTGVPAPNDISFALIAPGANGEFETYMSDVRDGLARGDDVVAYATVAQVSGQNYQQTVEGAGDIPSCGLVNNADGTQKFTTLQWDGAEKKWTCVDSDIKTFNITGANDALRDCPAGSSIAIKNYTDKDGKAASRLECLPSISPTNQSRFGSILNNDGNLSAVYDARLAFGKPPCADTSTMVWATGRLSRAISENRSRTTPYQTRYTCQPGDTPVAQTVPGFCFYGEIAALTLDGKYTCAKLYPQRNGVFDPASGNFSDLFIGEMEMSIALGVVTIQGDERAVPFYANGMVFGRGTVGGEYPLCAPGFRAGYLPGKGLGCFILNDPQMAAGAELDQAIHFKDNCPKGQVMRVMPYSLNGANRVECIDIMEAFAFAMPGSACPPDPDPRLNRGPGALTWDRENKRFRCTFVDRCNPQGSNVGLTCPE